MQEEGPSRELWPEGERKRVIVEPALVRKVKTRKEISHDYRQRLTNDPEAWQSHREAENARFKEYYARRSEEAIQRNREKQRERQRAYRERCKARQKDQPKMPKTRKETEKQRQRWAEEKRIQRQNMSAQKKAKKVCKKRKEKSAQTKLLPLMASSSSCTQDQPAASDQESAHSTAPSERVLKLAAQRGANSRFRKKLLQSLPSGASERAEVLAAGIESLSPATTKSCEPSSWHSEPKCKVQTKLQQVHNLKFSGTSQWARKTLLCQRFETESDMNPCQGSGNKKQGCCWLVWCKQKAARQSTETQQWVWMGRQGKEEKRSYRENNLRKKSQISTVSTADIYLMPEVRHQKMGKLLHGKFWNLPWQHCTMNIVLWICK